MEELTERLAFANAVLERNKRELLDCKIDRFNGLKTDNDVNVMIERVQVLESYYWHVLKLHTKALQASDPHA
jgi:hypothetical protein